MGARTVWLGPPGSGKTTRILNAVRGRLHSFRGDFRIVAPTATMAEHLRNELAREGFTLRSNTITTVTGHALELAPGARVMDATALEIALEEVLSSNCPPAFAGTRDMPGFLAELAAVLEELINAGCDANMWPGFVSLQPRVKPLMRELGGVWSEVQARLGARGLITRHEWLLRAAQALRGGALPEVDTFYWDGFSRLGAAELDLIHAHGERGDVTVSLPAWPGALRSGLIALRRTGFAVRKFSTVRPEPRKILVRPATEDDEALEIARRVLEHHHAGRAWHEIGVVVRAREPYVPLLKTAFARFGIPVRTYFAQPLEEHPVARLFSSALDGLLSGWDWEPVLDAVLSPAGLAGACAAAARFEYEVRGRLPEQGLEQLRALAVAMNDASPIVEFLDRLAALDHWRAETLTPTAWAKLMARLNTLLEPPRLPGASGEAGERRSPTAEHISIWRARAAAARAWTQALSAAAAWLPDQPVYLDAFLKSTGAALRDATVRDSEFRRDAVRLIDVQEARQWEIPIVFVCGLLEGSFPRAARPDPILGEDLRGALRRRGIGVRTRSDRDSEERFLFDVALSRATIELVLSYPRLNEKGEETLGAFALSGLGGLAEQSAPPCDLSIARKEPPPPARAYLTAPKILSAIASRHKSFSPTGLEKFLECAFQFFAGNTLGLDDPPGAPAGRFDALQRGMLVHGILAQYHRVHGDLLRMFRVEWERTLRKLRVPRSYRLDLDRILIERSLRMYALGAPEHLGWEQHIEEDFSLPVAALESGPAEVRGRIDRYEVAANGDCVVYDYKFSRPSRVATIVKQETMGRGLQAGIYLQAVRRKALNPVAFHYVAVKSACESKGWESREELESLMTSAGEQATRAVEEILNGRIEVRPIDRTTAPPKKPRLRAGVNRPAARRRDPLRRRRLFLVLRELGSIRAVCQTFRSPPMTRFRAFHNCRRTSIRRRQRSLVPPYRRLSTSTPTTQPTFAVKSLP